MVARLLLPCLLAAARGAAVPEPACAASEQGGTAPGASDDPSLLQVHRPEPGVLVEEAHDSRLGGGPFKLFQHYTERMPHAGDAVKSCRMSRHETCPMSDMRGSTIVYPGSKAACLNSEYAFVVHPGDPHKLVFFLQPGGACFNEQTYLMNGGLCLRDITWAIASSGILAEYGIFNRSDERNAYRDYTVVEVLYCSGDVHIGNAMQNWNGTRPTFGYKNVLSVLSWALDNTAPKLKSLVLAGSSAGALGIQVWANTLLKDKFRYWRASVLIDSFVGIAPDGTIAPILQKYGTCDLPLLEPEEQRLCKSGSDKLTPNLIAKKAIGNFPNVPFGFTQSKADQEQRKFYDVINFVSFGPVNLPITGPEFYFRTNEYFANLKLLPNAVWYYLDGETHMLAVMSNYYEAGTLGLTNGSEEGQPLAHEWVNKLGAGLGCQKLGFSFGCPPAFCAGEEEENNNKSTDFCAADLFPRKCELAWHK